MKTKIKKMIQNCKDQKKQLESIRDEKKTSFSNEIELFNENWTQNAMEMVFYFVEIEKQSAKLNVLNQLLKDIK
jgi:hypothetical protein